MYSNRNKKILATIEARELKELVENIRIAGKALGKVNYEITEGEKDSLVFRRSLFVVKDIKAGEIFTAENVRSIRPGYGLAPKFLPKVLGRSAKMNLKAGTPLNWDLIL